MIRKIKTSINETTSNNQSEEYQTKSNNLNDYDWESKNAIVEELDMSTFQNNNNSSTNNTSSTEETVLNAIDKNFLNNRNLSNQVNNQIYNGLKEKINQYIASNGGNI